MFELRADSKPRGEQATERLRWHELPKQDGQVHWLWDGALRERIGERRLSDHHEEFHGAAGFDLQAGSLARKTNVPVLHRGQRERSMPVRVSIRS